MFAVTLLVKHIIPGQAFSISQACRKLGSRRIPTNSLIYPPKEPMYRRRVCGHFVGKPAPCLRSVAQLVALIAEKDAKMSTSGGEGKITFGRTLAGGELVFWSRQFTRPPATRKSGLPANTLTG
ncbi:hypothetical protein BaRGS_00026465 [Batillaria attramentaria]|uniref:Uncharacterized protein n=1 Tax=Batillaria attramentaria TaxID=370345 RepID=A0ABD0K5I0_9CAEN